MLSWCQVVIQKFCLSCECYVLLLVTDKVNAFHTSSLGIVIQLTTTQCLNKIGHYFSPFSAQFDKTRLSSQCCLMRSFRNPYFFLPYCSSVLISVFFNVVQNWVTEHLEGEGEKAQRNNFLQVEETLRWVHISLLHSFHW